MKIITSLKSPRPAGTPSLKRRGIYPALMVFMLCGFNLFSQNFCHTDCNVPNFLQTISKDKYIETDANDTFLVRIYFHIIRRSDGSGGQTLAAVDTGFNLMKAAYQPHGICFDLLGMDEIWDDNTYYRTSFTPDLDGDGKFDNFSPNSHAHAIDIYLFPIDSRIAGGISAKIPGSALAVYGLSQFKDNLVASNVLSHEVGHCLGLYHTFHGYCDLEGGCQEETDGSNCDICGDFVCDTPTDPYPKNKKYCSDNSFVSNKTCKWSGVPCDCIGIQDKTDTQKGNYNPDTHLIMSYSPPRCLQYHTLGQAERMRAVIANSPILQNVVVNTTTLTLSGSISGIHEYFASQTISSTQVIEEGSVDYKAGREIILLSGFQVTPGAEFSALIEDIDCQYTISPQLNSSLVFSDEITDSQNIERKEVDNQKYFHIHSNPNPGTFQIETNFSLSDISNLKITNSLGATVYEVQNLFSNTIQLPTSVSGLHFVVAMLKTGTVLTQKMMVQR